MKIVLANRYFHPDQSATSRMVSSLAFSLAREGFPVTALASRHLHDDPGVLLPVRESVRGVSVHRLRTSGFGRTRIAGRAIDYATYHLSAMAWWLMHAERGDLCVLCTDPPLLAVSSALPIALRGAKLVDWVMDLFPETAIELGVMAKSGPATATTMALRNWALRTSDLTICPIQAMASHLECHGAAADRLPIVRHWSNGEEIRPVEASANDLRSEWGLNDVFVVGYSGNFGRAHEFATLLDAADRLRGNGDIRFLLIGDGQQRMAVEAQVRARGLTNVIFKPYQPSERLAMSLSAADVHIVSLLPNLEHCIVPSKFYGVLAAGRPTLFIGDPHGEIATVSRRAGCGECVAPGEADALAARILRLKGAPAECALMGRNARRLMETEYAESVGVRRWCEAVAHLLPREAVPHRPAATGEAAT